MVKIMFSVAILIMMMVYKHDETNWFCDGEFVPFLLEPIDWGRLSLFEGRFKYYTIYVDLIGAAKLKVKSFVMLLKSDFILDFWYIQQQQHHVTQLSAKSLS